jgi:hypothetical protein
MCTYAVPHIQQPQGNNRTSSSHKETIWCINRTHHGAGGLIIWLIHHTISTHHWGGVFGRIKPWHTLQRGRMLTWFQQPKGNNRKTRDNKIRAGTFVFFFVYACVCCRVFACVCVCACAYTDSLCKVYCTISLTHKHKHIYTHEHTYIYIYISVYYSILYE